MQKSKTAMKEGDRREGKDSADTLGVRGAGATWQADFGMALSEADLLFSVRREPVANRIVFQVAHDVFDNWFRVEEISDKPDPNFDQEVQKVLSELNAKARAYCGIFWRQASSGVHNIKQWQVFADNTSGLYIKALVLLLE